MEMVEALEEALSAFTGTLIMVSHDRAFIEGLADRIWLVEDGQFFEYPGWADYRDKHPTFLAAQAERSAPKPELRRAPAPAAKGKACGTSSARSRLSRPILPGWNSSSKPPRLPWPPRPPMRIS
ncbi:hypothetical protein ACFSC4_17410 [Deinococcus malanensis]|uniref:hypothetical protein n=1 Tax=Deinococcus malanensis TaxID=1706855 RepID=UPI0036392761